MFDTFTTAAALATSTALDSERAARSAVFALDTAIAASQVAMYAAAAMEHLNAGRVTNEARQQFERVEAANQLIRQLGAPTEPSSLHGAMPEPSPSHGEPTEPSPLHSPTSHSPTSPDYGNMPDYSDIEP